MQQNNEIMKQVFILDKLDVVKLKNVPSNFSNLKSEEDKLDVDKLVPAHPDLSKLIDVVKKYCC